MPDYLATVTLTHVSGFAEDSVVNTFAIRRPVVVGVEPVLGDITTALADFYNGTDAGQVAIGNQLGNGLSRAAGGMKFRIYDITGKLGGAPHGSPIFEDTGTLVAPLANEQTSLPEEVALVLTLRGLNWASQPVERPDGADPGLAVDRPRQRRSGRLYLGPFTTSRTTTASNKARPIAALQTAATTSAARLKLSLRDRLSGPYRWSVWSRVDQQLYEISDVQVDNAWDTQRRRGPDPTSRITTGVVL